MGNIESQAPAPLAPWRQAKGRFPARLQYFDKSKGSQYNPWAKCAPCKTLQEKKHYSADPVRYLDQPQHEKTDWIVRALDRIPWVRRHTTMDFQQEILVPNEQVRMVNLLRPFNGAVYHDS